jgi:DNA-binding response OmpR family regulator
LPGLTIDLLLRSFSAGGAGLPERPPARVLLASSPGRIFTRRQSSGTCEGGNPYGEERSADVHVHDVRQMGHAIRAHPAVVAFGALCVGWLLVPSPFSWP